MAFGTVWNATYEASPADTDQESLGAGDIRDLKVEIRERMQQDHSWAGDNNDGFHNQVTLVAQASDPAPTFDSGKSGGSFYTKVINTVVELFWKSGSNIQQLTTGGLLQGVPPGTVIDFAGTTVPGGYLECNGQLVSRSTYSALFSAIGTTWGVGDGSTTFAVPNLNGKNTIGRNGSLPVSGAGAFANNSVGATGGEYAHQQTVAEIAAHNHPATVSDPTHVHTYQQPRGDSAGSGGNTNSAGSSIQTFSTGAAATGISVSVGSSGSSSPMNIVQPGAVMLKAIKF